jgi:hypothetical protein
MTVKISDLNNVLQRISATMGLVDELTYKSDNINPITLGNLVKLLKNSQGLLESTKDDMKNKGNIERLE